jgi:hypothetical protein
MPTVMRIGPYRFFFYSNERAEPPHIHVQRGRALAKFWLDPVILARSKHFPAHEVTVISKLVETNRVRMLEAWHEHFDS